MQITGRDKNKCLIFNPTSSAWFWDIIGLQFFISSNISNNTDVYTGRNAEAGLHWDHKICLTYKQISYLKRGSHYSWNKTTSKKNLSGNWSPMRWIQSRKVGLGNEELQKYYSYAWHIPCIDYRIGEGSHLANKNGHSVRTDLAQNSLHSPLNCTQINRNLAECLCFHFLGKKTQQLHASRHKYCLIS